MNAEDAFINSKERNVFVSTVPAQLLLDTLEQGLAHASPIIVLTGETGLGKTTVMREAAARWGDRVHAAWLDAGRVPVEELFGQTIRRFGGHYRASDQRPEQVGRFAVALNAVHTRNLTPLLVVDDAHALSLPALAELGRIESAAAATNVPFKLVLLGRPSLLERLNDEALLPVAARIAVRGTIEAMSPADTREYLAHRVAAAGGDDTHGFSKKAAKEIHAAANGVPTLVNALSDEAQRCAHAAGTAMVGPEHVRAVIAAAFQSEPAPAPAPEPEPLPEPVVDAKPPGKERRKKPVIPEKPKVIKEHKAPATPPSAVAHTPPPTTRPATPLPPMSDLDSTSPRVRDWVSRFTDGQPPIRFGARIAPATREVPRESFGADVAPTPAEVTPSELEPAKNEVVAEAPAPVEAPAPAETIAEVPVEVPAEVLEMVAEAVALPELAPEPATSDESEAKSAEPEQSAEESETVPDDDSWKLVIESFPATEAPAPKLQITGLEPDSDVVVAEPRPVPLEVKPEQLTSPPLKLEESPAPYTPEPAAPVSEPEPAPEAKSEPIKPAREVEAPRRPSPEPETRAKEPVSVPTSAKNDAKPRELTAANVRPVRSKKQRAAARKAERAARRAAEAATRAAEALARGQAAPEAPRRESMPTRHTPTVPKSAAKPAPVLGSPTATTIASVLPRETESVTKDRSSGGPRSPRHTRLYAGIITGVLMLGMAAVAIFLGRQGGLRTPDDDISTTSTQQATQTTPAPVAAVPVPATPTPNADTSADKESDTAKVETAAIPEDEPTIGADEAGKWCLVVGSYLYEDRAKQIANKLIRRTKQTVRVVPDGRGAEKAYRIMYGSYATEAAAVRAADRLLARGIVTEAMVEQNPE